ncbi:MAG: enoyl-CoA hydratase/isomerase family protein [Bdellovibrionales bacterium]|nr:enoyl-CoA hydratase/isomerase family protein [Bdellovibrionales bacterium]
MSLVLFKEDVRGWGIITLNNPDNLNAMDEVMATEFSALIDKIIASKKNYRSIILTGSGRAFSAGGNLDMLEKKTTFTKEKNKELMENFYYSFLKILDLETPLIAAINGHAIGAGLCVASACDIRIAAESAKLGFTFTKLGLHPGMGGTYFLPKVVGYPFATELMLTGRVVMAPEAEKMGLISRIVKDDMAMAEAEKIAEEINSCGPEATKQLLMTLRKGSSSMKQALENEANCQAINYSGDEFKEGIAAIKEKRPPNF